MDHPTIRHTGTTGADRHADRRAPGLRRPEPLARLVREDQGAATAEYAVATLAAVGFAGLLVVIMRSDEVRQMLTDVVRTALTIPG
jgi:Flp pilus assembly pilin Flp